jgi:hypothetical protein
MPAADLLQPQQLQMFMKPSELKDVRFGDLYDAGLGRDVALDSLRQQKLYESDNHDGPYGRLTDEITANGVETPVRVVHQTKGPRLMDGHHRYFVQERREQQGEEVYLPVRHDEGWRP